MFAFAYIISFTGRDLKVQKPMNPIISWNLYFFRKEKSYCFEDLLRARERERAIFHSSRLCEHRVRMSGLINRSSIMLGASTAIEAHHQIIKSWLSAPSISVVTCDTLIGCARQLNFYQYLKGTIKCFDLFVSRDWHNFLIFALGAALVSKFYLNYINIGDKNLDPSECCKSRHQLMELTNQVFWWFDWWFASTAVDALKPAHP